MKEALADLNVNERKELEDRITVQDFAVSFNVIIISTII